jgi:multiple sugar transport system ATP-binding protein
MAPVQIRNLTKRHGEVTVVRGVDLDIDDGELIAIVGPSGCGKTSVLRMVAGIDEPTVGDVRIGGASPRTRVGDRSVAMTFQDAALYPHLDVRDNIAFPLTIAGEHRSAICHEVTAIATTLGIRPLLSRRPGQLSGGQRQRVAMARSLIRRPQVLLMDEPMSNLDAKLRVELRSMIRRVRHEFGITMIYVTHDQDEAMSLGDRIAVMREGQLVQVGPPHALYHHPVDAFVATFIGSPSMNLFVGRVRVVDQRASVEIGASTFPLAAGAWPGLRCWHDRDVVVGVRPQAIRFARNGVVADVEHVATVGDHSVAAATLVAPSVTVTPTGVTVNPGRTRLVVEARVGDDMGADLWQASHLAVDPADIHLFDPATGRSLRAPIAPTC